MEIQTNEWIKVTADTGNRPLNRKVLGRFDDGSFAVVKWNGYYWTGQFDMRLTPGREVTHFLMYTKFREEDVK